jgi:N-methylhydantoinase B/oxoprolinase/acetone carboxylase alpha subunit
VPRRAQNNPRQVRSKVCGCPACHEAYPEAEFGERKRRRDCIGSWQARYRDPAGKQKAKNFPKKKAADDFLDDIRTQGGGGRGKEEKRKEKKTTTQQER